MTHDHIESARVARLQLLDLGDSKTAALLDWAVTAEPSGWRPIETLPAEGEFLVFMPGERHKTQVMNAHVNVTTIGHAFAFDLTRPTHWQPLPQPPEA
jgi:hypothetical protein